MKIIAMLERSAGNDTVGYMWTETKIFDPIDPIISIIDWARKQTESHLDTKVFKRIGLRSHLTLQIAQEDN